MSPLSWYLCACVVWSCALQAGGAPRHERHRKHAAVHVKKRNSESKEQITIELPEALDKTVCPVQRVVDYDPLRVPQRIKMLKCAPGPSAVCRRADVARDQACCGHKHEAYNTQCVEVIDHVIVQDLSGASPRLISMQVSVGCSCMIRATTNATPDE